MQTTSQPQINNNAYIVELKQLGLIQISGPDAATFLQGQLTCDVRDISATHSSAGAYCNIKGRIIATFRIFQLNDNYYLLLPKTMIETMINKLNKYAVFSKVTLTDHSDQLAIIGCHGDNVDHQLSLSQYFNTLPETVNDAIQTNDATILKTSASMSGKVSRYICITSITAKQTLMQHLQQHLQLGDLDHWNLLTIHAGTPEIYPTTTEMFTPHDVNLPKIGGVSFDKGCYLGQEIVARMQYLGKLKQRMHHGKVNTETSLKSADPIIDGDGKVVGHIVNCQQIAKHVYELLAVVKDQAVKTTNSFVAKNARISWE